MRKIKLWKFLVNINNKAEDSYNYSTIRINDILNTVNFR